MNPPATQVVHLNLNSPKPTTAIQSKADNAGKTKKNVFKIFPFSNHFLLFPVCAVEHFLWLFFFLPICIQKSKKSKAVESLPASSESQSTSAGTKGLAPESMSLHSSCCSNFFFLSFFLIYMRKRALQTATTTFPTSFE